MNNRVAKCVIAVIAGIVVSAQAESGLHKRGTLDEVKTEVGGLITLKFDRSAIRLDRGHWGEQKTEEAAGAEAEIQMPGIGGAIGGAPIRIRDKRARVQQSPAEAAFRRVQAAVQSNHSSGMTSNNTRSISFKGPALSGLLEAAGEVITIRLNEVSTPARSVELIDDTEGALRLLLTADDGDVILINQAAGGATSVACIVNGKNTAVSGKSFAEVFSRNREVFEKVVFPTLEHVGIGLSLSANTPQVRAAIVAMLSPMSDEDQKTAARLLADLASPDFPTREAARERLAAAIDRYRPAVQQHARADGISKDVAFTLEQLLNAADADPARKIVVEMKLLDDPKFLVSIIEALDADSRKVVMSHLSKLTGESFGEDIAAWQKWAAEK